MILLSDKDQALYDALSEPDKDRIDPLIRLFEASVPEPGISFYNHNILYLTCRDQLTLGLSPRKQYISFYMGSSETMQIFLELLPRLGKINAGVGCLRFRKLVDLDTDVLKEAFGRIGKTTHSSSFGFNG